MPLSRHWRGSAEISKSSKHLASFLWILVNILKGRGDQGGRDSLVHESFWAKILYSSEEAMEVGNGYPRRLPRPQTK